MKKLGIALLAIGLMFGLAACGKKAPQDVNVEGTPQVQNEKGRFNAQDYTRRILPFVGRTEKGLYNGAINGLMYYDFALKKNIYLCNKPECKHDGNQYCVATTSKYKYLSDELYGDTLLISAVEETDTQYVFQLLVAALDGSALEDYMTIAKVEKASFSSVDISTVAFHRNYAIFGIELYGTEGLKDSNCYATYLLNLNTKEVTCLDEEEFGKESICTRNASGDGDYLYYVRWIGGKGDKRKLYRRNIISGEEESFEFKVTFDGRYFVEGNKILYHIKGSTDMLFYDITTGSTQRTGVNTQDAYKMETATYNPPKDVYPQMYGRLTIQGDAPIDERYVYCFQEMTLVDYGRTGEEPEIYMPVVLYDLNGNYIKTLDAYPMFPDKEELPGEESRGQCALVSVYGEDIYLYIYSNTDPDAVQRLFCCNRDAFFNETGTFELIYKYSTKK